MWRERAVRILLAGTMLLSASGTVSAANKEHLQLLADIRMLQEQTALLRAQLSELRDVLKSVGSKLDEQAGASRKAFADQKLLVDTISSDLRVVREKVDDNNVRVSSLSQELEAVRMAMPPAGGTDPAATGVPPSGAAGQPPAGGNPAVSPQRLYDQAWGDYVGAQYNLAISGFENYIRTFPKSELAGEAQYFIGESYYLQRMFREAVTAYDRGISDYPTNKRLPDMYYKRGMARDNLGQTDLARESWEFVLKNYPNSDAGRLARQSLDRLIRREPGDDWQDDGPES